MRAIAWGLTLCLLAGAVAASDPPPAEAEKTGDLAGVVEQLKETISRLSKELAALRAENAELRTRLEALNPRAYPTEAEKDDKGKADGELLRLPELLRLARQYLADVPRETQAAAAERRRQLVEQITGRPFELAGTLTNVTRKAGEDLLALHVRYESTRKTTYRGGSGTGFHVQTTTHTVPTEVVDAQVSTADTTLAAMPKDSRIVIHGRCTKVAIAGASNMVRVTIEAEDGRQASGR